MEVHVQLGSAMMDQVVDQSPPAILLPLHRIRCKTRRAYCSVAYRMGCLRSFISPSSTMVNRRASSSGDTLLTAGFWAPMFAAHRLSSSATISKVTGLLSGALPGMSVWGARALVAGQKWLAGFGSIVWGGGMDEFIKS